MKFSSKIEKCEPSPMRKFLPAQLAAEARGLTVYKMNIGQPDIETPEEFYKAVREFRQPVLSYAPSPGVPELLKAVQGYYQNLGLSFGLDQILATTGGSEALNFTITCILDNEDEILIPEPFYPNYATFTNLTGGVVRPIPTSVEDGYHYASREKIEPLINEHTRAIMVTNPGNPTGFVLTHEEMRLIADIVKEHDLFLIADEVYREFVYGGEELSSFAEFEDIKENLILIDSISKRFSACGARVGLILSHNMEFMAHALKLCQSRLSSATLDQLGAAALYSVGGDYFAAVREEYKHRRDTCMEGLSKIPGVVCDCPKGAFYIMAKLPVDDTDKFQSWLLEEFDDHGDTVMFAPGEGFYGTPGKGRDEVRFAYTIKEEKLKRAMEILAKGIETYRKTQM